MASVKKIRVSIVGASGYTGAELIRILHNHPKAEIVSLIAEKNAGQPIADIYTHLRPFKLPDLIKIEEANWKNVDVVFCCLPHATSQEVIKNLPKHLKIIDLSADFRLTDAAVYKEWYGHAHQAPKLQKEAVYGLCELFRNDIKKARLIANPGCYPTTAIVPLFPLLEAGLIESSDIIIDSKSGTSGAGRSAKQDILFCEVNDGFKAYGVCKHRHMPEIEQELSIAAGKNIKVHFSPQLVAMNRGILSTIYVKPKKGKKIADLRKILEKKYKNEAFVHVLPNGQLPSTRDVYTTNQCIIGLTEGRTPDRIVIVSVIDNLVKGASGQAVQNMNIIFGIDETTGLDFCPVFP